MKGWIGEGMERLRDGEVEGWRGGGMERLRDGAVAGWSDGGRKRGMDTIPRYPRRAAGDFANSTWPEAKMRYTHVTFP